MLRILLGSLLITLPLIELALLIKTGQLIGFWATLAIVVGTGLLGIQVLLGQSWAAMWRLQEALARGEPPVAPVVDGAFLVLAGGLLVTPGLLSDAVGLLLLVPPIRHQVARWVVGRLLQGGVVASHGSATPPPGDAAHQGPIIEGEFERLDERATGPHRRDEINRV